MISVVMFGHAMLPYVTVPRRFKDSDTHVAFDAVGVFLYGFAMPAFFVTAGFATASLFARRGLAGLARSRFHAIFLPLLVAYLLLSPLTRGAYAFASEVSATGSLRAGIDLLAQGHWIRWSKAYHLWFLVSLLLYTAVAVFMRWFVTDVAGISRETIRRATRPLFAGTWRPARFTAIVALTMTPAYIVYDGDATTWPMQLTLILFFVFGWLLFVHRDVLPSLYRDAWPSILAALAVTPVTVWATRLRLFTPDETAPLVGLVAGLGNAVIAVSMTYGLIGLFEKRFSGQPSPLGQYVSDASYWLFLIHFPLLIFTAGALSATSLPALAKYLLTVAIVVPLVFATYHFGVRTTAFGRLLKGRKAARANDEAQAGPSPDA